MAGVRGMKHGEEMRPQDYDFRDPEMWWGLRTSISEYLKIERCKCQARCKCDDPPVRIDRLRQPR